MEVRVAAVVIMAAPTVQVEEVIAVLAGEGGDGSPRGLQTSACPSSLQKPFLIFTEATALGICLLSLPNTQYASGANSWLLIDLAFH